MSIKDRTFFLFAMDRLLKNSRGYRIPVIDLGKYKEVTTVLKLITSISPKGLIQYFTLGQKNINFFML